MDFLCKYCGAEIEAEERCRGTIAPCPGCSQRINVPDLTQKQCPSCRQLIALTAHRCGRCNALQDESSKIPSRNGIFGQFLRVFKHG